MEGDHAPATEAVLLRGLRGHDQEAFRKLVELNSANVYHVALKILGDQQEAEDVLQETFLNAFQAMDRFEGKSKLSTWLYRIATNASLMRLRKRGRITTYSLDHSLPDDDGSELIEPRHLADWSAVPDEQLLTAEARAEMERTIADLPESLRVTFVLRDIQGLSGAETAEVMGITVQAVKNRLHRARLRLREHLSSYFVERVLPLGTRV